MIAIQNAKRYNIFTGIIPVIEPAGQEIYRRPSGKHKPIMKNVPLQEKDHEKFPAEEFAFFFMRLKLLFMPHELKSILPRLRRRGRQSVLLDSEVQFAAGQCRALFPV